MGTPPVSPVETATTVPDGAPPASVVVTTVPTGPLETTAPTPLPTSGSQDPVATLVKVAEIDKPIAVAWGPNYTDSRMGRPKTMFVATQHGQVLALGDGEPRVVLDITEQTEARGEQGLLGLAIHPRLPTAYVDFTNNDGDTVVAEFQINDDGTFDKSTQRTVLTIDQPYSNHNGGDIHFGPDEFLYIATGDGGSGGDPQRHALNLDSLLGKILRIDPAQRGDQPYSIPPDNPFAGTDGARPEIWSYGLRNPWRFSFDRSGDLWIADVGQGDWEEIDWVRGPSAGRGVNFGWSAFEGSHRFNDDQPVEGAVGPFYEYPHTDGRCSVSGGTRYGGEAIPALQGWYVYSDYCQAKITALAVDGAQPGRVVELAESSSVAGVVAGPDGELYVLSLDDGLFRLQQS